MKSASQLHRAAWLSLISIVLTAVAITVNHLYSLGPGAYGLGAALSVLPVGFLLWFRATKSRVALTGYALMSLWIVIGFGLYKGLWSGLLRLFLGTSLASLSASFPKPIVASFGFEASGILMFVGGLFVAHYGFEFVTAALSVDAEADDRAMWRRIPGLRSAGALFTLAIVGAYVVTQRDSFVPPRNGVVTIGVIAPVTGPYSVLGNSFVKAVQMAQNDLRNTKYRYVLRIEDSGPDPAAARDRVRQVIEGDQVNAVIGAVSLIGQVTKPFATSARVPHICICTVLSIGDGAYNFTNIPSPEAEAIQWVDEARRRGVATMAIIQQDYPSINNHAKALKAEAARQGLRITYENRFPDTTRDFAAVIGAARGSKPDVYYFEALEPALDILGEHLMRANVRNIASVVAPSLSEKPALFEGAWYTDSDLADMEFKRRFEAAYPGTRFATHMMPYAYDSFNMIVRAYEDGVNPATYVRAIRRYVGTAGTVTKAPGSGNFQSAPTVWTIVKGRPTLLRETEGTARTGEGTR